MHTNSTNFTVAEYCYQLNDKVIQVNHDYQRSDKVWPAAAKSYLIETILLGFPLPKFSLHSKTDLKTKKTVKDIVDGQQRSMAILNFFNNKFRITGKGPFAGKKFNDLDPMDQQSFLDYSISADIFLNATEKEIREVFRRMNSYNVPLKPQEQRHAVFQGEFKWFIVEVTNDYAQALKKIGVFSEPQLTRMLDGVLFSEFCYALSHGITTANEARLNEYYDSNDPDFPLRNEYRERVDRSLDVAINMNLLHNGTLMKPFMFLPLLLAISHVQNPVAALSPLFPLEEGRSINTTKATEALSVLAEAINSRTTDEEEVTDDESPMATIESHYKAFIEASSKATNTETNRGTRFQFFCHALLENDTEE